MKTDLAGLRRLKSRFRLVPAVSLTLLLSMTAVLPSETRGRGLHVVPEASCDVADAMPAQIAALPHFSQAIESRRLLRIVAIGSSSTEGVGASSPSANYPSQLRALLQLAVPDENFEVINLGVGGETADLTAERLRRDIPKLSPDLVVWQVGTNDALTGVVIPRYRSTVAAALEFLKAGQFDTLLIGLQWTPRLAVDPTYVAVRDATARVARMEGVSLVSRYDSMRKLGEASGREDFIGPDHLHMNDHGYRCLAEQVAATLARAVDEEESGRF